VPFELLELDGFANYNDVTVKIDTSWEGKPSSIIYGASALGPIARSSTPPTSGMPS
jgi:hypothetical protein